MLIQIVAQISPRLSRYSQGTINVPNWAPDGSAFAFVRYEAAE
jgi:hypothetical protein